MPKQLTEKEVDALNDELNTLHDAKEAMGDGMPFGFFDESGPIEMFGNKGTMKELAGCFKTGGVDGSGFLAKAKELMAEWKVLSKAMSKRDRELDKQIAKIEKKLANS